MFGVGRTRDGNGKATRNVGPPHGTSGGAVQRVPQAQGSGASKPRIRTARVRHLRGSRSPARGIVPQLRRAEAAAGARALLRLLQARMAVRTRAGCGGAGSAPAARDRPPPRLNASAHRQRQSRTAWSGPSEMSANLRIRSGPPAVDASVAPSGDHATAVTTSLWPVNVSITEPEAGANR